MNQLFEINMVCIFTFNKYNQDISDYTMLVDNNFNEEKMLTNIFNSMELDELMDLAKISCNIIFNNNLNSLFINSYTNKNGKYYFNTELNNDDDTQKLANFKELYIKSKFN